MKSRSPDSAVQNREQEAAHQKAAGEAAYQKAAEAEEDAWRKDVRTMQPTALVTSAERDVAAWDAVVDSRSPVVDCAEEWTQSWEAGDVVDVEGRAGVVKWDGRPEHQFVGVLYGDTGELSPIIHVAKIKKKKRMASSAVETFFLSPAAERQEDQELKKV